MSLTISQTSQPTKFEPGNKHTHDFNPRISLVKSRFSPNRRATSPPPSVSLLRVSNGQNDQMAAPHHSHRGLPPPSAMTLPDPHRSGPTGPPSTLTQQLGSIPEPPRQWQGQEDSMRNWLAAKAEEDKRRQEEEKTRQESLKLEQRKIEQSMLRESLQGGVPPAMVPMIYASIGGGQLVGASMDLLQQYASQLQVTQQQIQQSSPDMRRDGRLIGPPAPYPGPQGSQQQMLPGQHPAEPQQQGPGPVQTTFSAYQPSSGRSQNTSALRAATLTQLPRLTTNEMYVHQPPPTQQVAGSAHPLQQSQTIQQDQPAASPSIYFHHWQPPNESKTHQQPHTPARQGESGSSGQPGSHTKDAEYKDSPRKRKAQGDHQTNPPPSAGPQYTSPSFSTTSSSSRRGVHGRTRSNTSATQHSDSRPESSSNRLDHPPPPFHQKVDSGHSGIGNMHATVDPQKATDATASSGEDPSRAPSAAGPQEPHPGQPRPGSR